MRNALYILPEDQRPNWLTYPRAFQRIVEQSLVDIAPWHIMEAQQAAARCEGLAKRYPSRMLFPFAFRQDNDDLACWSMGAGEKVFVIHDFASPGWENVATFEDVWSWFRSAVDATASWD